MPRKVQMCRHCGGPTQLTDEEKAIVRTRLRGGEGPVAISRELRVSRQTVYRLQEPTVDPNQATIPFPQEQ